MEHFYDPKPGDKIYHYTSLGSALKILENKKFRMSEFSKTNDSSEYIYARNKFVEWRHRLANPDSNIAGLMSTIMLTSHERHTVMLIGCFSHEADDIGLWERYGDQGSGCVIEFDACWLRDNAGVHMRKIVYSEEELGLFLDAGFAMLSEEASNANGADGLANLASFFVADLYAFKDPRWKSEREIRISRLCVLDEGAVHGLRDVGGHNSAEQPLAALDISEGPSPYGQKRFLDVPVWSERKGSAVSGVRIGPKATAEMRETFVKNFENKIDIDVSISDAPLR